MLYAILACHIEEEVTSWTPQVDAALMADLNRVHNRLTQEGRLGPAARLGTTKGACFLRGAGDRGFRPFSTRPLIFTPASFAA